MPDFTMLEHLRRPWSFDEPEVREWAARRIESLEARLELQLYHTPDVKDANGEMVPAEKVDIGELDGISCRDETIKLQDERIKRLEGKLATLMNSSKLIYELEDVKRERDDLKSRLGEHSTQLEQALRDVRQAQRSMETSNGYVTVGRRLHDVEKILARIVERGSSIDEPTKVGTNYLMHGFTTCRAKTEDGAKCSKIHGHSGRHIDVYGAEFE